MSRNSCGGSIESRANDGAGRRFSPEDVPGNEVERRTPELFDHDFNCGEQRTKKYTGMPRKRIVSKDRLRDSREPEHCAHNQRIGECHTQLRG